jgi:hypothetical protein
MLQFDFSNPKLAINEYLGEFDVCGSIHLGNICFYLIPTGCTTYMLYFFLEKFKLYMFRMLFLHPSSGAQLQCTAIGFYGFCVFHSIDKSLRFEMICCHPYSRTNFWPQISKVKSCIQLPRFVSRK